MGIMGKKNKISNIKVKEKDLSTLKIILSQYFNIENVKEIRLVIEGKNIFEVVVNSIKSYRLDTYNLLRKKSFGYYKKRMSYQKMAYENNVNVPKIIGFHKDGDVAYKVSTWINGKRIGFVWNTSDMFRKAGIEIAKINSIQDPKSGRFLGYNDFTKPNAIWTNNKEIFLVDVVIQPKRDVNANVVKILRKNLNNDLKRSTWFLEGYETIRNTDKIIKMLKRS